MKLKIVALGALMLLGLALPLHARAAIVHPGAIPVNHIFATYVSGAEDNGDWLGAGYSYTIPSSIGNTAGNTIYDTANGAALDGSWVHDFSGGGGTWFNQGLIFDLGLTASTVDVFPFIDHVDPGETALQEGVEIRVWASNDLTSWFAASWTDAWALGYNAATIYDDYTSRWDLGGSFRYVGIASGNPEVNFLSEDAEIDAVGVAVPEPASIMLLGAGLVGLAGRLRTRRRS